MTSESGMAGAPAGAASAARLLAVRRMRITAVIVASALFMQNLDSTVVATALPALAHAFHADPVHMSVALTAYMFSLATFIPASGWMADRFGARLVFRVAIVVFTVGSVLCGMAPSFAALILARILQGAGGAMMIPVGRLVLLRSTEKGDLVAAMSWLTVPALIGPVLGPPLGGFLVTFFSWRWIFDINVPIGIAGVIAASLYIDDVAVERPGRFDWRGFLLAATALAASMFGVETIGRGVVAPLLAWGGLGLGIAAGAGYGWHARRHPAPLLDFTLMRLPTFRVSVLSGSLFRLGVGAVPFLLPLLLQVDFGRSPVESGLITLASAAGALAMKPLAQPVLRHFGFRAVLLWNGVIAALLLGGGAFFRADWPLTALYGVLLAGGLFRSLQFTAYNSLAYAEVSRARMSAATGLYSAMQHVTLTLGITVGALVLELATAIGGHTRPHPADFSVAFAVVAGLSLLATPLVRELTPEAGAELAAGAGAAAPSPAPSPAGEAIAASASPGVSGL